MKTKIKIAVIITTYFSLGVINSQVEDTGDKVGIGNTNPNEKLHVNGNQIIQNYSPLLKLRRDTDTGGFIQGIQTQFKDGKPNFYFGNLHSEHWIISKGEYNGKRLFTVKSDGKIGIGENIPQENLHVNGNQMIQNYSPLLKLRRNTDTGGFIQGIQTQFKDGKPNFYFGNLHSEHWIISKGEYNGKRLLTVKSDGKIGIGENIPEEKLHVHGNGMIQNYSPLLKLRRDTDTGGFIQGIQTQFKDGKPNFYFGNLHSEQFIISKGEYNGQRLLTIKSNGNGALNGKFEAKEIKVTLTPTADFVFDEKYNLPNLESVEKHIKEKKHLPEVASAKEMKKNGVNVGKFQIKLLQKIEELTLYTIQQEKEIKILKKQNYKIEKQQKEIEQLNKENTILKSLLKRVSKLEEEIKSKR